MVLHIARRELAGNLLTLRFPLAATLIIALFLLNALVFVGADYSERLATYALQSTRIQNEVYKNASALNELAVQGPQSLPRRPSPLSFTAGGHEKALPIAVDARARGGNGYGTRTFQYNWDDPWALSYPYRLDRSNAMLKTFLEVDWVFIIGLVVSFIAIVFTYDAVCGEREQGTLRLMLAAPIPRHTVLLGKSLGAFLSITVPVALGMALNLLLVLLSGHVELSSDHWARLGLMGLFSCLYIALFTCLGLLISARCKRAATSLLSLLLIWVVTVILIPNTLGSIAAELDDIPPGNAFNRHRNQALNERTKPEGLYDASPSETPPQLEALRRWSDYLNNSVDIYTRLTDAHLDAQFRQIEKARALMRISPAATYQYTMESLAGTGFIRHKKFIQAARQYRSRFIEFIKTKDREDPDSPHVYLVKEGLSDKPVDTREIPPFFDRITLADALSHAALDAGILLVLCILLFACAYVSFLRYDPR